MPWMMRAVVLMVEKSFSPKRLSGMAKMINQFSRTALKLSGVARKL